MESLRGLIPKVGLLIEPHGPQAQHADVVPHARVQSTMRPVKEIPVY